MLEVIQAVNIFQDDANKNIVINQSVLLKKIQLIKKYYAETNKTKEFFNSQSFDTKAISKEIFELFFSKKYYQGVQPISPEALNYIISESDFKFNCKKSKRTDKNLIISDSNVFEFSKQSQIQEEEIAGRDDYHYYGQILNAQVQSSQKDLSQKTHETAQNCILHGFGLLINLKNASSDLPIPEQEINCYFGQFVNGHKHGEGMELRQNSNQSNIFDIYIGNFINGNYEDAKAVWLHANLTQSPQNQKEQNWAKQKILNLRYIDKYFGGFVNGKKHGKGKISSAQLFYDGQWRFDKPQGIGQIWTLTSYYKGRFKSGLKHRNGKEWFKNGDIYQGCYSNNKPTGFGKYVWKNGSFYEGQFKNGLRDGKGLWKSGPESYQGNYVNDKKSGEGIYYWNDGQTYYKGSFYEDFRHGYGEMFWDNRKSAYKGKWKQGFQDGYGEVFQVQPLTNQLKLIKRGQFIKGSMVQQISDHNQTSLQASPERKSFTSQSDELQANPSQKSEQFASEAKTLRNPNKKPTNLRKPSLIKGIQSQKAANLNQTEGKIQHLKDIIQLPKNHSYSNERKRFVKSQIQSYNQRLDKQDAIKHIQAKHRYLMEVQKVPVQKEHLYGSVYLIKSSRKKIKSSVQNASRKNSNHQIQLKSGHLLPNTTKTAYQKSNRNNRSNSYSNTPIVNKFINKEQSSDRLEKIQTTKQLPRRSVNQKLNKANKKDENQIGPKQHFNLPKRNISNQGKYQKLRYFDPEHERNLEQLEPLIVWNNFSKNTKRSFLK